MPFLDHPRPLAEGQMGGRVAARGLFVGCPGDQEIVGTGDDPLDAATGRPFLDRECEGFVLHENDKRTITRVSRARSRSDGYGARLAIFGHSADKFSPIILFLGDLRTNI